MIQLLESLEFESSVWKNLGIGIYLLATNSMKAQYRSSIFNRNLVSKLKYAKNINVKYISDFEYLIKKLECEISH